MTRPAAAGAAAMSSPLVAPRSGPPGPASLRRRPPSRGLGARNIGSADDERADRRHRRRASSRTARPCCWSARPGRGVEVHRRRHDLPADLRQADSSIDRRPGARSQPSEHLLGGHRRELDAQQRLDRRRRLQDHRRRRDLDQHGPAELRAHLQDPGRSGQQRHRLCLRARPAVERQRRPRPLQDHRRRQDLVADPQGRRTSPPAARRWPWIRRTRASCSRACGTSAARAGASAPAARTPTRPRAATCCVSEDGGASWTSAEARRQACPRVRGAARRSPSRRPTPTSSTPSSKAMRSALFRSDDGGKTWSERDRSQNMVWRPFYFANLTVDPDQPRPASSRPT